MAAGVKKSLIFNNVLNAINLSVWVFIMAAGMFYVDSTNWSEHKGFLPYGWSGVRLSFSNSFFYLQILKPPESLRKTSISSSISFFIHSLESFFHSYFFIVLYNIIVTGAWQIFTKQFLFRCERKKIKNANRQAEFIFQMYLTYIWGYVRSLIHIYSGLECRGCFQMEGTLRYVQEFAISWNKPI